MHAFEEHVHIECAKKFKGSLQSFDIMYLYMHYTYTIHTYEYMYINSYVYQKAESMHKKIIFLHSYPCMHTYNDVYQKAELMHKKIIYLIFLHLYI